MLSEEQMKEYDLERLRKRIIRRELLTGFLTGLFSDIANTSKAYSATPEQLLRIAARYNINLDRYKIKKES